MKKRERTAARGFTLIELMLVVAVIGILTAIAYPSYVEQVRKSKRAEGKVALLRAAQVMERSFTNNNVYPATLAAAGILAYSGDNPAKPAYTIALDASSSASQFQLNAAPATGFTDTICNMLTYTNTQLKGVGGTPAPTGTVAYCW